jgi:nucleoside-diphosphate-sugar epimerase
VGRVVVTGGAGFLGSHLCDALLDRGDDVIAIDNLITGRMANLAHLDGDDRFTFIERDISAGLDGIAELRPTIDTVMHFASPASPPEYLAYPIETLRVGSEGTRNALELARLHGARFMVASTSEVYGDPEEHPQPESYWGNVNSIGPRSCYDEAKRFAEAITVAYRRTFDVNTVILRVFNTYGPRMAPHDGRVVSNFLVQALEGKPLTMYGDGTQTRSFCYVDDEIRGILALLDSGLEGPVNIGNDGEFTMIELAEAVKEVTGSTSEIVWEPLPEDDPRQRQPDLTIARTQLGWKPTVSLRDGLARTAEAFATELGL